MQKVTKYSYNVKQILLLFFFIKLNTCKHCDFIVKSENSVKYRSALGESKRQTVEITNNGTNFHENLSGLSSHEI